MNQQMFCSKKQSYNSAFNGWPLKASSLCLCLALTAGLAFPQTVFAKAGTETAVTQQQTIKVTGQIIDATGFGLPGVNIAVKGTTTGTISDVDGNYSIDVPANAELVFSFMGYQSQTIQVKGQTVINLEMKEDSELLDEVVVTALGMSREKKALGYAMTEIKGDEIAKVNVVNPINGIQGKVAGVQINMGNSGPQSSQRILIRGNSSLGGNNQPIFVVDGVIIDNEVMDPDKVNSQTQDFGNDLKNLNADDFESMSVLKGAAATALYGSRAANGVVLITTKKGKKGSGIGVSLSHSETWDVVYATPDVQNEFGMGTQPVWSLNSYGSDNRHISTGRNFGPRFDGQPYYVDNYEGIFQASKNNIKDMYQTGRYMNTNVAVSGGDEKGAFRFSYSNLKSNGVTFNNDFSRNSFSLNASRDLSKFLKADGGFAYIRSKAINPTYQGGDKSPVYDFMFNAPREYDVKYWLNNYKSAKGDGYNGEDPFGYSSTLFDYLENRYSQVEDNFRANLGLDVKILDWLTLKVKGDIYKIFKTYEAKVFATGQSNYDGSKYEINDERKDQYKVTGMLSAHHSFEDFNISGSVAAEQWDTRSGYHKTKSTNGLRIPGQYDMTNSVAPATTEVRYKTKRKRINSVYAFANMDYKSQIFLDITGRNDWSSALIYADGTGTTSYFYPSVSASWIMTETFRDQLPDFLSFAKIRGSYAVVGNDCDPYLTTATGYYTFDNTYVNPFDSKDYPYYKYDSEYLRNNALKPEKQYALEFGLEAKFFNNRLGFDLAYYKTNTKNQILALSMPKETGVTARWINAGNIQNSGVELLINATPIETKDWLWDLSLNLTHNSNKIIELAPGVERYKLKGGGGDTEAWATVGGAYGDIYTSYAYTRNEAGEKILNQDGSWRRSGTSEKIGSIQPKLLGGLSSSLTWKNLSFNVVLDARFGGDIFSGSYNYGMSNGILKSSLFGRTEEYGGLPRTLDDGRVINDGMIPEGVFAEGININGTDVSGMSYQEAYEKGLVKPLSAYKYYANLADWGSGIRETGIQKCSWIALRELSLRYSLPSKWISKLYVQNVNVGLVCRNVGFLYNSLPDNINPEGLRSNYTSEYYEAGGSALTRNYGFSINVSF